MSKLAHVALLNEYLGAALSASNDLVADLCGPAKELGLSGEEHCALLVLWTSDGVAQDLLAERLHPLAVESALASLERKGLIQRSEADGEAHVWLTDAGREVRALIGTEAMSSRFGRLKSEIVALRDVLQRTIGLLPEDAGFARAVNALA